MVVLVVAVAAIVALATSAFVGGAEPAQDPPATGSRAPSTPVAPGVPVSVTVDLRHPAGAVPARYLGLSFEASALGQIATYGGIGDFATMLRSLGPGILRFGGISADTRIAWSDRATPRPAWTASVLEAAQLGNLRTLAERSGWRVLLTVGLAHYDPAAAAREAAAAKRALGPWLAGIEVGNEPDAYAEHHLRSRPWTFGRYDAEVKHYVSAIARVAPGIPLAGPGVSGSHVFTRWGPAVASALRPAILTGHHYPLGCRQRPAPSIPRLLSANTRLLEAKSLDRYMKVSRASGIPFRMDEANSVSCGGQAGVSNTFASALWATGYIAQTMASGVSGINFQGNPANCLGYSAVCAPSPQRLASGALGAQPLWYALLLTSGLVGDRPVATAMTAAPRPNVTVTALISPAGALHFVIVDEDPPGSTAAAVSLHVGAGFGAASVLAMTAPSPESTSGVRLGGRAVGGDGSWRQPSHPASVPAQHGVVTVSIPASSAALVTVAPAGPGHG